MSALESTFAQLGLTLPKAGDDFIETQNPATGETLARVPAMSRDAALAVTGRAYDAFPAFAQLPAPARGEIVRQMGDALRAAKEPLSRIVSMEVGKVIAEARGEVQEMIDICDFAVGLSRTIGGHTLPSERPGHRMFEQWHPLGPVLCISAFNFPVAVWSWNAAIALVCGDPVVWKPSPKAVLCAIAVHHLMQPILAEAGHGDVLGLCIGRDAEIGDALVDDARFPLVSATGSTRMGKHVAPRVAGRLGRYLLELGGNNALIVDKTADLELAQRAIVFGAAGTAGQRCTSTRRLFIEQGVHDTLLTRVVKGYQQLESRIGDPLEDSTLVGPLIDADAVAGFERAIARIRELGGEILTGGKVVDRAGHFVEPTIVKVPEGPFAPMDEETFAPILYVRRFADGGLEGAIAAQNAVPQGLSSSLFSDSNGAVERFLSPAGSDCGIANINIGTSGAEIGGAFGGEKETGGGREAGSDAWKAYMRRQTCTINGSGALPLSQGIVWE